MSWPHTRLRLAGPESGRDSSTGIVERGCWPAAPVTAGLAGILRPAAGPSIRSDSGGWAGPAGGAGRSGTAAVVSGKRYPPGTASTEIRTVMPITRPTTRLRTTCRPPGLGRPHTGFSLANTYTAVSAERGGRANPPVSATAFGARPCRSGFDASWGFTRSATASGSACATERASRAATGVTACR